MKSLKESLLGNIESNIKSFCNYINNDYKVINLAKNGRSSKSFYDEGLFK